jgi:hypothetical protein
VPLSRSLHMGLIWPRLSVHIVSQLHYTLAYPILAYKAHPIKLSIWPGPPDVSPYVLKIDYSFIPPKFFSRPFGCTPMTYLMATVYPFLYKFTEIAWHACQAQCGCRSAMHHAARALHDMVAASYSNYYTIGCKQPCKRVQALTESHDSAG